MILMGLLTILKRFKSLELLIFTYSKIVMFYVIDATWVDVKSLFIKLEMGNDKCRPPQVKFLINQCTDKLKIFQGKGLIFNNTNILIDCDIGFYHIFPSQTLYIVRYD